MTTEGQAPPPNTVQTSSRRKFLRQAGSLLGAGTGVLLLSSHAQAAPPSYQCCVDSSCPVCPGGPVRYRCTPTDGCSGSSYCDCFSADKPRCFIKAC